MGADSRAAKAISHRAGSQQRIIGISRRQGPGQRIQVYNYTEVPPGVALAGATIVNCVGTDRGTLETLRHLNVDVPRAWAMAGAEQGARQFVQLSSFSVYGRTERINAGSPLAPRSDYGRSKLAAEQALSLLGGGPMQVSVLRVPILLARGGTQGHPDKLAQLIALMRRLHVVPRPAGAVERSMISYDGLAAAVEALMAGPVAVACAADPEPFSYELARIVAREHGVRLLPLPIPKLATSLARTLAPEINDRVFASSVLALKNNLLVGRTDFLRVRDIVASHFA